MAYMADSLMMEEASAGAPGTALQRAHGSNPQSLTLRKDFPETWIYESLTSRSFFYSSTSRYLNISEI